MEILHAYSAARLAKANNVTYTAAGQIIPGTKIMFSLPNGGWALIANANGLTIAYNRENMTMDITDGIDPARTESYWVTCGWKWTSRSGVSVPEAAVYLGTKALASPDQIFALAGGAIGAQVAFTEVAYNPITKEIRVYVNGNRLPGTFTHDDSVLSVGFGRNVGRGASTYVADMYVARYEGNEEPRLRRWKMDTLVAATNELGSANVENVDGAVASVQAVELKATYAIPTGALAVVAHTSAESVNNASDLVSRVTDGTTTATKRQSSFKDPLGTIVSQATTPYNWRGHGMVAGSIKPAAGATTLTVGLKAVDRT